MPTTSSAALFRLIEQNVCRCRLCPRLVEWREKVALEKVPRYSDVSYWGKAVPGFGDPAARVLIVGLAPAAHGANRTGRMFTGDRSGEWLYRALHTFGFADRSVSVSNDDGLRLTDCYITAVARCAPPANKPLPVEIANCRPFLLQEARLLTGLRVVVGLGKTGFDAGFDVLRELGKTATKTRPAFGHGKRYRITDHITLMASYHPSQQNTFTGKLTRQMFHAVFRQVRKLLDTPVTPGE